MGGMKRRNFLGGGLAALGLTGCVERARNGAVVAPLPAYDRVPRLMPIRAHADRIFRVTVCLRPFRAAGPRLDVERVGDKTVVHNYGHGGSGWSLSWGSSSIAVEKAMGFGEREVGVIGCSALGMTSAILLQRAGCKVTIYAKERPPDVRSARATGSWTPDSRIALTNAVSSDFPALWEKMSRYSFHMYESYSIADLAPRSQDLPRKSNPSPTLYARRNSSLTFNVADYSRQVGERFLVEGGKIVEG